MFLNYNKVQNNIRYKARVYNKLFQRPTFLFQRIASSSSSNMFRLVSMSVWSDNSSIKGSSDSRNISLPFLSLDSFSSRNIVHLCKHNNKLQQNTNAFMTINITLCCMYCSMCIILFMHTCQTNFTGKYVTCSY